MPGFGEPLQHLRDGRLGYAKTRRNVDLPRLAGVVQQVGDQLDVVFGEFGAARLARLPKALDMILGRDQRGAVFLDAGFRLFGHVRVRQRSFAANPSRGRLYRPVYDMCPTTANFHGCFDWAGLFNSGLSLQQIDIYIAEAI